MNLSDIAIVASIIAGLASVPFVASTISNDYGPIGDIVLNMSSTDIPGELSRSLTNEKFEQTYQTPFGKFTIKINPDGVYQELVRPDRKVIVQQTPDFTAWELFAQDYNLVVNKTGTKVTEKYTSPDGYREATKEMGNTKETVRGNVDKYDEAKELLEEEIQRMEKIKRDYMELPGTERVIHVVINEVLPNPEGDDAEGEFIELYSYEESEVDLTGWYLEDGGTNYTLSGNIEPEEFLVLWRNETGIALNNNGDDIKLYDNSGKLVDSFEYEDSSEGKSWARVPDGTGEFQEVNSTPGYSNG